MKEFLISVASGLVVALISALFLGKGRGHSGGQSQSMSMNSSGGTFSRVALAFVLGAIAVYVILTVYPGRVPVFSQ